MSLERTLAALDDEITSLQQLLDPANLEQNSNAFIRLRALSLGRTFLRSLPTDPPLTLLEIDTAYAAARKKLVG